MRRSLLFVSLCLTPTFAHASNCWKLGLELPNAPGGRPSLGSVIATGARVCAQEDRVQPVDGTNGYVTSGQFVVTVTSVDNSSSARYEMSYKAAENFQGKSRAFYAKSVKEAEDALVKDNGETVIGITVDATASRGAPAGIFRLGDESYRLFQE